MDATAAITLAAGGEWLSETLDVLFGKRDVYPGAVVLPNRSASDVGCSQFSYLYRFATVWLDTMRWQPASEAASGKSSHTPAGFRVAVPPSFYLGPFRHLIAIVAPALRSLAFASFKTRASARIPAACDFQSEKED